MQSELTAIQDTNLGQLRYRPDIDGLRAVAVISVILYHLGLVLPGGVVNRITGGFVGVDIFFVISGYLITGMIQRQVVSGKFSLADFYSRRIRRILPAFFSVLALISFIAGLRLFPAEISEYDRSAISAIFSVSNIYFWRTTNYFAGPAMSKPLLHTWSLGVEEQFYLLWPFILILINKFRPQTLRRTIPLLAACSFVISSLGVRLWPDATFYLVIGRIWELALGGMLVLNIIPAPNTLRGRQAAGVAGMALIVFADLKFTIDTPFPGPSALMPCVGAALIIAAGMTGAHLIGRILAWKPAVYVGLISYSLYLWHWPVLVFQRMFSLFPGGDLGKTVKIEVLFAIMVLSMMTHRFVEQPFRHLRKTNRWIFMAALLSAACCSILCLGILIFSKAMTPLPAQKAASFLNYLQNHHELERNQLQEGQHVTARWIEPLLRVDPSKRNILVLADSHANHLVPGLKKVFPEINFLEATGSGCRLLLPNQHSKPHCDSLFDYLYADFLPKNRIDGIILEGRWDDKSPADVDAFAKWARTHGYPVIIFGPMVQYDQPLPRLIAESIRQHDESVMTRHRLDLSAVTAEMRHVAQENHDPFLSWSDTLCGQGRCQFMTDDETPLLYDYGHLTEEGATFVVNKMRKSGALKLESWTSDAALNGVQPSEK